MKHIREKVQVKLNSMASILLDDIIVPDSIPQSGQQTIESSFFDKDQNRYTFNLTLTVTPKVFEDEEEDSDPIPTLSEQIAMILQKLTELEEDVATLKGYHVTVPSDSVESIDTQGGNNEEQTDNP